MAPQHPDEKLLDKRFVAKYLDILTEPYKLSGDEEEIDDERKDDESESNGASAILTDKECSENLEEESDYFSEDEFGDLYDENDNCKSQ